MSNTPSVTPISVTEAAQRVVELEAELESSGTATTGGDNLAYAKAALHDWVDSVVGVVAAAGSGRVTLIHANGSRSQIASPEVAYLVSPPIKWGG
jgi:ABC-type phosphonate transport system ATPase subunit